MISDAPKERHRPRRNHYDKDRRHQGTRFAAPRKERRAYCASNTVEVNMHGHLNIRLLAGARADNYGTILLAAHLSSPDSKTLLFSLTPRRECQKLFSHPFLRLRPL
jgi:hypothetical protein